MTSFVNSPQLDDSQSGFGEALALRSIWLGKRQPWTLSCSWGQMGQMKEDHCVTYIHISFLIFTISVCIFVFVFALLYQPKHICLFLFVVEMGLEYIVICICKKTITIYHFFVFIKSVSVFVSGSHMVS